MFRRTAELGRGDGGRRVRVCDLHVRRAGHAHTSVSPSLSLQLLRRLLTVNTTYRNLKGWEKS